MQNVRITLPTATSNTRHAFINIPRLHAEILMRSRSENPNFWGQCAPG